MATKNSNFDQKLEPWYFQEKEWYHFLLNVRLSGYFEIELASPNNLKNRKWTVINVDGREQSEHIYNARSIWPDQNLFLDFMTVHFDRHPDLTGFIWPSTFGSSKYPTPDIFTLTFVHRQYANAWHWIYSLTFLPELHIMYPSVKYQIWTLHCMTVVWNCYDRHKKIKFSQ